MNIFEELKEGRNKLIYEVSDNRKEQWNDVKTTVQDMKDTESLNMQTVKTGNETFRKSNKILRVSLVSVMQEIENNISGI